MADTTYTVKVNDELKERLQCLIEDSGLSSKDFFADMVSRFELAGAKQQAPMLASDIDELMGLTARINRLFTNVGERFVQLQEANRLRTEGEAKEKDAQISQLQQEIDALRTDAAQREARINRLTEENNALGQLSEINQKNNELLAGHQEKIAALSGLLDEYRAYAEENKILRRTEEDLSQRLIETEQRLDGLREDHRREMAYLEEKTALERDRLLLAQREQHQQETERLQDRYQQRIDQLLQHLTR